MVRRRRWGIGDFPETDNATIICIDVNNGILEIAIAANITLTIASCNANRASLNRLSRDIGITSSHAVVWVVNMDSRKIIAREVDATVHVVHNAIAVAICLAILIRTQRAWQRSR